MNGVPSVRRDLPSSGMAISYTALVRTFSSFMNRWIGGLIRTYLKMA